MDNLEKNNWLEEYINEVSKNLNEKYPNIIKKEQIEKAILMYKNSTKTKEEIKEELDKKIEKKLEEYKKHLEELQKLQEKFKLKKDISPEKIKIKQLDISSYSYEDLDKLFYHYSWQNNFEDINENGIKSGIGENSQGIDKDPSIFFSKGIEGVLQLWDVWLKWRLARLNNPYFQEKYKNIKEDNPLYPQYQKELNDWVNKFTSREYKNDTEILEKLYEYQYIELKNSYYFILNLKENEHFKYDQIDIKKLSTNGMGRKILETYYGNYSNLSSNIVDKWNMQTIPGKNINIPQKDITQIQINGQKDVLSILEYFYELYHKNIPKEKQCNFDLLDNFIKYTKDKKEKEIVPIEKEKTKVKVYKPNNASKGYTNIILISIILILLVLGIFILKG